MLFDLGNKTWINVQQIVTAQEEKGGDEYRLFMNDDKVVVVTKSQFYEIRTMPAGSFRFSGVVEPVA